MIKIRNDKVVNDNKDNGKSKMPYRPFDPNERERITDSFHNDKKPNNK